MSFLFPEIERPPQPTFDRNEVPDEVRQNFGLLLDWFTPNIFVSWIILAINVAIFVLMPVLGFNPDHAPPQGLLRSGADYGPATLSQGQ